MPRHCFRPCTPSSPPSTANSSPGGNPSHLPPLFASREEAARLLVPSLTQYQHNQQSVLLAISRHSLELACHVSQALALPVYYIPIQRVIISVNMEDTEQHVDAAVVIGDTVVVKQEIVDGFGIPNAVLQDGIEKTKIELHRKTKKVINACSSPVSLLSSVCSLFDSPQRVIKNVIVVADACILARRLKSLLNYLRPYRNASCVHATDVRIVLVGGVMDPETQKLLKRDADEVIAVAVRRRYDECLVRDWFPADPSDDCVDSAPFVEIKHVTEILAVSPVY